MRKGLTTFLTVIFVIAVSIALIAIMQHISTTPSFNESGRVSEESGNITSADTNSNTSDNSDTASFDEPQDTVISFLACPDNIIHPSIYADAIIREAEKKGVTPVFSPLATAEYDFYPIYENVAADIAAADIAFVNVETLIGGNENGIKGYPMFNTPEAAGETLYNLGFDIYNLAHNHMLDSGDDKYLINCYNFFKERNGTVIGYYENEAATENIVIMERKGIKIALLTYTYSTNGIPLPANRNTYIPYFNENLINKQVALAKQQADIVLVFAHWGNEDTYLTNNYQRTYAQQFVNLGVDAIIGMHPHVIQPMEWVENGTGGRTLLVYSLGNFISGSQDAFNMLGGTLGFDIIRDKDSGEVYIDNVLFTPVVTHYIKPGRGIITHDTGHREYKIHYLKDYTEELAATHGAHIWEKTNKATLVGGKFSKANLVNTVKKYIPEEFLSDYFKD